MFYRLISSNHSPFELRGVFIDIFMSSFDHLDDSAAQACAVQQHLLACETTLQITNAESPESDEIRGIRFLKETLTILAKTCNK